MEFEAYGDKKEIVRQLVDEDDPTLCHKFFEFQSEIVKPLSFSLLQSLNQYKNYQRAIIPILIECFDMDEGIVSGCHSIVLIIDHNSRTIYDPNGYINDNDRYLYYINGDYFTTDQVEEKYGILISKNDGIQNQIPIKSKNDTKYIAEGGYCMFYCWLAIKYFVESVEANPTRNLIILTQKLSDPDFYLSSQSPFYKDISLLSKEIIDEVFSDNINF